MFSEGWKNTLKYRIQLTVYLHYRHWVERWTRAGGSILLTYKDSNSKIITIWLDRNEWRFNGAQQEMEWLQQHRGRCRSDYNKYSALKAIKELQDKHKRARSCVCVTNTKGTFKVSHIFIYSPTPSFVLYCIYTSGGSAAALWKTILNRYSQRCLLPAVWIFNASAVFNIWHLGFTPQGN